MEIILLSTIKLKSAAPFALTFFIWGFLGDHARESNNVHYKVKQKRLDVFRKKNKKKLNLLKEPTFPESMSHLFPMSILFTFSEACCSIFFIQLWISWNETSSVTS
jgi:hypothetical protein